MEYGISLKGNNDSEVNWEAIDSDILLHVADYISDSLLHKLGLVCCRWEKILRPRIWQNIYQGFDDKTNKMELIKKYGKYVKWMEHSTMSTLDSMVNSYLEYTDHIWYYYLYRFNSAYRYSPELLSFNALPKVLTPIPNMKLSDSEDWMNLVLLSRMENSPVIKGYYLESIQPSRIKFLTSIPLEMKQNVKYLELIIDDPEFMNTLIKLITIHSNLLEIDLYFCRGVSVDDWDNLDLLLENSGKITNFVMDVNVTRYRELYEKEITKRSRLYTTNIKYIDICVAYTKSNRTELSLIEKNSSFNFFHLLIQSSPQLTEVVVSVMDYNLLKLLSINCPNLDSLCIDTPLPAFDNNVKTLQRLKKISVCSFDEIHLKMNYNFETIFPNVTQVYIDHYMAHIPTQCTHHDLYLLPQLFPKMVSLKLSHDISDITLEKLLLKDQSLYITHLYLHSRTKPWPNLSQLIKKKLQNLHSITYNWAKFWDRFNQSPVHSLVQEFPYINFYIAHFIRPFYYKRVS
jgi:hypothetical protein